MKPEEYEKFQRDIDAVYGDIIRMQRLFSVLVRGIEMNGEAGGEEIDALDAAVDYFSRIIDSFNVVMTSCKLQ